MKNWGWVGSIRSFLVMMMLENVGEERERKKEEKNG